MRINNRVSEYTGRRITVYKDGGTVHVISMDNNTGKHVLMHGAVY